MNDAYQPLEIENSIAQSEEEQIRILVEDIQITFEHGSLPMNFHLIF